MDRKLIFTALAGLVGGLAAGQAWGYFMAKKHLREEFDEELKFQLEMAKRQYQKLYKRDQFDTPATAVEALNRDGDDSIAEEIARAVNALTHYQGKQDEKQVAPKVADDAKTVVNNIFAQGPPPPREVDENEPHLIDIDEFVNNETGYEQYSLTYYMGDGVLADDKDQPIEGDKLDMTVGDNNLAEFQKMGEIAHCVYVRNHKLRAEFEISRSEGKYSEEVLGLRE